MQDFKKLIVWKKAHELALNAYAATRYFPAEETFGLRSQMRRASSSIGINVAEGWADAPAKQSFVGILEWRKGSASELEYELLLARDLKLLSQSAHQRLTSETVEIKRMTTALIRKLKTEN